jgi:sensor histidine kinase YesM
MRFFLTIVFLIFTFQSLIGQTIPSKNITINDGLPSNSIKCFFKDSRGYIWIGTDAGLCRYDGRNYKVYNESNGLRHTKIWSITEDKKHNLWLSVYGNGLAKFDGKKFTYFNEKNGLINNNIRKIHYSKKHDCLILATENGVSIFDGKKFKSFQKKKGIRGFQIVGIDEIEGEILITSSFNGVYKLNVKQHINESSLDSLYYVKDCYSSFYDSKIYYCSSPEQYLFKKNIKNSTLDSLSNPIIWDYTKVKNSIYCSAWNVTDPNGGLFEYKNNSITNITQKASITSNGLWCNYYDQESKQLWVGSIDKGIYRVDLSNQIEHFNSTYYGLKELQIQELFVDKNGAIWMGCKDNIVILKRNQKQITITKNQLLQKLKRYFHLNKKILKQDFFYTADYESTGFTSFNITSDNEGLIWINNTWGLFCLNSKLEIIHFYGSDGGHAVFDMNDHLYYGGMYSTMYYIPNKFDRTNFTEFSMSNIEIPKDINKIVKQGKFIWFGTNSKGLFLLQKGVFKSLLYHKLFKENNIKELILNSNNELVIGTNNGRVFVTKWENKKLKIIHEFKPYKEIIGSSISFIEYVRGTYFIGTNKGINVLQHNRFVKLLNKYEGIADIQFNDCVKDRDENLWIGTNNGLIKLNTRLILEKIKHQKNPIRLTAVFVNGKRYNNQLENTWGEITADKIKLTYKQNDVQLMFSTINNFNAKKNLFRYKIDGLSNVWSKYLPIGNIQLLGVPNGRYLIHIEGKNSGIGCLFEPKVIQLIITPPFWKTPWFISFLLVLLITISYLIIRYRIKLIERRESEKAEVTNKLTETKLEALRAQMNPHFTFNAMNSIQNYIIDNDTTNALHYLGEFSKLIRQTLENASEKLMPLETEIRFLESYMNVQKMRFDRVITRIKLENSVDKYRTLIPPLILQPFIENAFEHAFENDSDKQQTIDIHFYLENGKLVCTIRDNGTGYNEGDSNSLHKSFGQKLTIERLELLNREFDTNDFNYKINNLNNLDSNLSGTEVRITFQLILE